MLKAIRLPELNVKGKPKRMCCWCTEGELFSGAQKYCSQECSDSAMAWAYPQKENALLFILIRQGWKCLGCSYDYKPWIDRVLSRNKDKGPIISKSIFWYHIKRLKRAVPPQYKPEVDHIVPISKGGQSLGLDNHQIICFLCHKAKTKIDNSGPRNKS